MKKLYTKLGDQGTTTLINGNRVSKDALQIEIYGEIDELNAATGIVLTDAELPAEIEAILSRTQQQLLLLIHSLEPTEIPSLTEQHILEIEADIDSLQNTLPPLNHFVTLGGTPCAAHCHFARTICRRAERRLVSLSHQTPLNPMVLPYINRLGDLLFIIARTLNYRVLN